MCRPALASDVPAIVALLADDELGAQREYAHTPLDPAYLHAFDAVDANPNELLAVACIDDRVIGTLQMTFLHHLSHRGAIRAHIESVRVASSLRGRGIGHELMEWALDRARGQGARIAQLSTDKTRTDAHRFYESLGFHATHEGMKFDLGER